MVSSSAPGTSLGSSGSSGKFLFYTGRIVTTEWLIPVLRQHICDCFEIHHLHRELCDLLLSSKSPKIFRSGHDGTGASSARSPHYVRPQTDIAIPVFREVRKDIMLTSTGYHFCSRLPW